MTSEPSKFIQSDECFVWAWLPNETKPVVAGRLYKADGVIMFNYGKSYLARKNAISLYDRELPLTEDPLSPLPGLEIAGSMRDAAPDAWGRRVIINRYFGAKELIQDPLSEIDYLLSSGSDRIGALDFQTSSSKYIARNGESVSLEELLSAAERIENGIALTPQLEKAIRYGTSIGGARPKALISDGKRKFIAKFSSTSDTYSVVKGEFMAMRLAHLAGMNVAQVKMKTAAGKDVLLVERFDREKSEKDFSRKYLISALTLLELNELMVRHTSYQDLAEIIRTKFSRPQNTLRELFSRLIFNILCGNTDDHARNHAAFWDGRSLTLTPAYDICPQRRTGRESNQAMLIHNDDKRSQIETCLQASASFLLSRAAAIEITEHLIKVISSRWDQVAKEAKISEVDQNYLRSTVFSSAYAFEGLRNDAAHLKRLSV